MVDQWLCPRPVLNWWTLNVHQFRDGEPLAVHHQLKDGGPWVRINQRWTLNADARACEGSVQRVEGPQTRTHHMSCVASCMPRETRCGVRRPRHQSCDSSLLLRRPPKSSAPVPRVPSAELRSKASSAMPAAPSGVLAAAARTAVRPAAWRLEALAACEAAA